MKNKAILSGFVFCLFFLMSCAPVYSPYIYDQTAELKMQSLAILNKGQ